MPEIFFATKSEKIRNKNCSRKIAGYFSIDLVEKKIFTHQKGLGISVKFGNCKNKNSKQWRATAPTGVVLDERHLLPLSWTLTSPWWILFRAMHPAPLIIRNEGSASGRTRKNPSTATLEKHQWSIYFGNCQPLKKTWWSTEANDSR